MTISIRIQYKGEAARKLAMEESSDGATKPPRHLDDVTRILSLFSIPPPDYTRPIYKSGFILCNYNTTRESKLCESVERGTRRAQSIACKKTLENLSISRPIFLSNKAPAHPSYIPSGRTVGPYQPRRRSLSPTVDRPQDRRPLTVGRSWPLVPGHGSQNASSSSQSNYRSCSADRFSDAAPKQHSGSVSQSGSTSSSGLVLPQTLQLLSESPTLQALLQESSPTTDRPIKQEEDSINLDKSQSQLFLLPAKRSGNDDAPKTAPPSQIAAIIAQSQYMKRSGSTPTDRERAPAEYSHSETLDKTYVPHGSYGRISRFDAHPVPPRYEHRPSVNTSPRAARSVSPSVQRPNARYSSTIDRKPPLVPFKRPLSPPSAHRRSTSPLRKKRIFEYARPVTPKRSEPITVGRIPTQPKAELFSKRLPSPTPRLERPQSPKNRVPVVSFGGRNTRTTSSSSGGGSTPVSSDSSNTRNPQTLSLNRELWDVRRQITALKARETSILDELENARAPVLPQGVATPKAQTPEEKMKALEVENLALRERLQKEIVRSKLAEEACENERRRRKHAEGMLDDARREYSTPLVVPAMMDAFEKIAQLTGDALMTANE